MTDSTVHRPVYMMKIMHIECELIRIDLRPHVIHIEPIWIESELSQSTFRGDLNVNLKVD